MQQLSHYKYHIDIGRPDIFNENHLQYWKEVHKIINNTPNIIKNSAFQFIETILEQNGRYGGGGMKYMFAFQTEKELTEFKTKLNEIKYKSSL